VVHGDDRPVSRIAMRTSMPQSEVDMS
jgi:hypothetical protein